MRIQSKGQTDGEICERCPKANNPIEKLHHQANSTRRQYEDWCHQQTHIDMLRWPFQESLGRSSKGKKHKRTLDTHVITSIAQLDDTHIGLPITWRPTRQARRDSKYKDKSPTIRVDRRGIIKKGVRTMVEIHRQSLWQETTAGGPCRPTRHTWRSKSFDIKNTWDGDLLARHSPWCYDSNKDMCRVSYFLPSTRTPSYDVDKHIKPMSFLPVGNRYCWAIPGSPRESEIPRCRGRLLHQVDGGRTLSTHSRKADDQILMEEYPDEIRYT